jgi:hypothetical protein
MQGYIAEHFNPSEFSVTFNATKAEPEYRQAKIPAPNRVRELDDRLFGGDALIHPESEAGVERGRECTLGFNAYRVNGRKNSGEPIVDPFVLTAGHCAPKLGDVWRYAKKNGNYVEAAMGTVADSTLDDHLRLSQGYTTDAESVGVFGSYSITPWIWASPGAQYQPTSVAAPYPGEIACNSGINGGTACGVVTGLKEVPFKEVQYPELVWEVKGLHTMPGDSGGPVWDPQGPALGIWTGGHRFFTPLVGSKSEESGVVIGKVAGVLGWLGLTVRVR